MKKLFYSPIFIGLIVGYSIVATYLAVNYYNQSNEFKNTADVHKAGSQTCWDTINLIEQVGEEQALIIELQDSVPRTVELQTAIDQHKQRVRLRLNSYINTVSAYVRPKAAQLNRNNRRDFNFQMRELIIYQ